MGLLTHYVFLGGHHLYKWHCAAVQLSVRPSVLAKNLRESERESQESRGLNLGVCV